MFLHIIISCILFPNKCINNTCNYDLFIVVVYTELAGTVGHSHTYDDLHDVIYYVQVPEDYRLRLFALTGSHVSRPLAFKVDFR